MPERMKIKASLGMMFPARRKVVLAGESFPVIELQFSRIAIIERAVARIAGHPLALVQADREAIAVLPKGSPEWRKHARAVSQAGSAWPPTMGSTVFLRALATPQGAMVFLKVMLRRFQPKLTSDYIAEVGSAMDEDDWRRIEAVAWGFQDWESFDAESGSTSGPGRGIDWAEAVWWLASELKMPMREIGHLFVSQFMALRSGGEAHYATLPDWPLGGGAPRTP